VRAELSGTFGIETAAKMPRSPIGQELSVATVGFAVSCCDAFITHNQAMIRTPDIDLPFDVPSAMQVLEWGTRPEAAPYTHQQIAEWCDRFWRKYLDLDVPRDIERLLPILAEVDREWDMRPMRRNATTDHGGDASEDEHLPTEWFEEWLVSARAGS
jgi:hypothetical protein